MRRIATFWAWLAAFAWLTTNTIALEERELRGSMMGSSVAIDGDYAVVGASSWNSNQGRVYVFKCSKDGNWTQTAILTASDYGGVYSAFGNSVGISGQWIIVGAPWYHRNDEHGRIYFFKRNGDETWTENASVASTASYPSSHGTSVAIDGVYAVAGDPGAGLIDAGCISVYKRVGDVWSLYECRVQNPNGWVRTLGRSVDICSVNNAAYIVAGAPESYLDNSHLDRFYGRAFSFFTSGDTLAAIEIVCDDVANQNYFGNTVAIDRNDRLRLSAAVGSCLTKGAALHDTGAVYLFDFGLFGDLWSQRAKVTPPVVADADMRYGSSISLQNDVLAAVGVWNLYWPEVMSGFNAAVYLYYRNQGGPDQWGLFGEVRSHVYDVPGCEMDFGGGDTLFGDKKGIALSGNRLLVGAPNRYYEGGSGAAFVFTPGSGASMRAGAAGVRVSEVADNSPTGGTKTAYIELYNPTNVYVSLADTHLIVGKNGNWNYDSYRFPPFASIPSNGCLVVSGGALMDDYEQAWNVDLDTARYHYQIGADNLHIGEDCSYRLEEVTRGSVPNPDTTNVLDTTVVYPGGCRAVRGSQATNDWRFEKSGPWDPSTPGTLDDGQFSCAPVALPFYEDWSSYSITSNNWTIYTSTAGMINWTANNYPNAYIKYDIAPSRTNYKDALATPLLSGRAKGTILLGFDLQLDMWASSKKGYTTDVLVVSADWVTTNIVATYTDIAGDATWNNQSIDITSSAHEQYFRVLFRTMGKDFTYLNAWYLDNISVTATEPTLTPPTITYMALNPLMFNSLQMYWTAGSGGRLHRVYYGTNLVEGLNQPLGSFTDMTALMRPKPVVPVGAPVFFRVRSLP